MTKVFRRRLAGVIEVLILMGLVALPAAAQGKTYKHLVVASFDVPSDTDFPSDFALALRDNLVQQLEKTKRFEIVTYLDKDQAPPSDADLVLTCKIVQFDRGDRAARYIAPGSGMTKIKATVTFASPGASQPLLQRDVSGKVVIGVFGGSSTGATNGLAKDVAKAVRKELP